MWKTEKAGSEKKSWGLFRILLGLTLLSPTSQAFEFRAQSGLLQLPHSSYHHLAYKLDFGLGSGDNFRIAAGLSHPYSLLGFTLVIYTAGLSYEWGAEKGGGLNPFGALGLGFVADTVSGQIGWMPALNMRAGLRWGGARFGLSAELDTHVGFYDFSQFLSWTVWPVYQFMMGIYVAL